VKTATPCASWKQVEQVNDAQKSVLYNKIKRLLRRQARGQDHCFSGDCPSSRNTDDMREAPSVVIANLLTSAGAHVRAYDPVAMEEAKHQLGDSITYCNSYLEATDGADALALITEWTEFRVPDWDKVGRGDERPSLVRRTQPLPQRNPSGNRV
jgi:UDPglucose 6-dehydrogenase